MTAELRFRTASQDETRSFGRALGELLAPGSFVGLEGPLGSGKTVVVQGAAQGLGYDGYVTSPTFVIVNEYKGRCRVLHVDLYRITDARELEDIGYREIFYGDGVALVEWADRAPKLAPRDRLSVEIAIDGHDQRSFRLSAVGGRATETLERLGEVWGEGLPVTPLLTIETSTPVEHVAVVDGTAVLAESRRTVGRGHTETLLATVDTLLAECGVAVAGLAGIIVSVGPGRFSGLRVGLATAKGLSAASGVPVFPVGTLPALAVSGRRRDGLVCPVLDARRGELYGALFRRDGPLERLLPDEALAPGVLAEKVRGAANGVDVLFLGSGVALAAEEVAAVMGAAAVFADPPVQAPEPFAMAALAAEAAPLTGREAEALEPVYLRGI